MAFRLVIAEKPSMAQTIAAALGIKGKQDGYIEGGGYLISWCVGHLVQLAEAAAYGEQYKKWSFDSLPILPEEWQYAVDPDKGKQFKTIKELMHRADVSEVVNACDAGREGELIFRFVYEVAGCKKPMRRLWISSMEDGAIKAGFASLKDGRDYGALFASALCRAKADWLIGINATRLFSCLYGKTLNVGRVQTPTLKMLVDRDAAITGFQKETYYHVRLTLPGAEAASAKICAADEAGKLKAACEASAAVCTSLTRENKTAIPPKLFDLTSLQREANRIYGYTAKQTLDLAQTLYEKKLLTYPRTDSAFLTDDMSDTAAGIIKLLCGKFSFMAGKDFTPELGKVLNSKKVSDHHAIIPTVEIANTDLKALPGGEKEILMLIASKLLCASEQEYIYESIKTEISCHGELFTASGKNVLQYGWKEVEERFFKSYGKNAEKPEEEESDFPDIKIGQVFECVVVKFSEHFTAPPKHYTEDTLLSAMEHAGSSDTIEDAERKGLGTPATRAAIIEKLIEKGFIERKKKQILPTTDGRNLIRILPEMIKSPKLTAEWENDLTLISRGQKNVEEFLFEIEKMVTKLVSDNGQPVEEYQKLFSDGRKEIGKCPRCGNKVYVGNRNYYCSGSDCNFTLWKNNRFFESQGKKMDKVAACSR